MAMKFPAVRLKKSVLPYVSLLAEMKLQDLIIRQQSQSITMLEYVLKEKVMPMDMEIKNPSSFDEARNMFSKMISEAAAANITDKEVRDLGMMSLKKNIRMNILSTKLEHLHDQLAKKLNKTVVLQQLRPPYQDTNLAYQEIIVQEMDAYNKMYESLIMELPGLNISNASDASVDFVMKRFFKLDEAIVRRVLDEWVAFKRDLHLAMEKFDFTMYLLDNKSDLIFKGDYEGLTNVIRSDEEILAKNHREEAVSELLQNWKYYNPKGASRKKVKSFKESIQHMKEHQYDKRMCTWELEALYKKLYRASNTVHEPVDMVELMKEVANEDASLGVSVTREGMLVIHGQ